ncbi:hypothetical protein [Roseisalinus antarcticus]|uniref:Uncharacterized protein n=1 Tax=Roseisalinus antarcticus TaxID=254357 RepID=A0A1Y5RPB5_9RHOB|nr:hypothetical protein [Roseisalinus antarcticus]SLN22185.1 hypothetical protein ROA7023_00619 [Roseisalinus antarcticus]
MASGTTVFSSPVPTPELRGKLEAIRSVTFANPQHPDEPGEAPPEILKLVWRLTSAKAIEHGLASAETVADRSVCAETTNLRFFGHLLQHRKARAINVGTLCPGGGSAHDPEGGVSELVATSIEVAVAVAAIGGMTHEIRPGRSKTGVWFRLSASFRLVRAADTREFEPAPAVSCQGVGLNGPVSQAGIGVVGLPLRSSARGGGSAPRFS